MKNGFFLILGLLIVFGSIFLFLKQQLVVENQYETIRIENTDIKVEVADTRETQTKGLSGRESLADGTGMLFVFDQSGKYGFWMKDMNFAIDIVWIDEGLRVASITRELMPETFPQVFYPNEAVKYVLEVPGGFLEKHYIDIGQIIFLSI